jgi:hypothetical protein
VDAVAVRALLRGEATVPRYAEPAVVVPLRAAAGVAAPLHAEAVVAELTPGQKDQPEPDGECPNDAALS